MKDEKHTIDDLFKDRLYDVESDVQPQSWDAISKKINAKPAFSIKKWFYGAGIASTVVALAVYVIYSGKTNVPVRYKETVNTSSSSQAALVAPESPTDGDIKENAPSSIKHDKTAVAASVKQQASTGDERKTLQLPDGSEVILNRNTSVSYSTQFLTDRTLYVSGEVYVNVAAGKGQKLTLVSRFSQIETAGSSFIVKSDKQKDYDEVFVSTGKVDCKSLLENADRIVIFAGSNVVINRAGDLKQNLIQDVNYNDWVTQKIVFNNTALNNVFTTLEQYYNVSLKADNAEIMNCHFTGTFERNNIDEILQVLSVSFNLSFNQKSKEYILSGKGCK